MNASDIDIVTVHYSDGRAYIPYKDYHLALAKIIELQAEVVRLKEQLNANRVSILRD